LSGDYKFGVAITTLELRIVLVTKFFLHINRSNDGM